jgi:hypothetical protein
VTCRGPAISGFAKLKVVTKATTGGRAPRLFAPLRRRIVNHREWLLAQIEEASKLDPASNRSAQLARLTLVREGRTMDVGQHERVGCLPPYVDTSG